MSHKYATVKICQHSKFLFENETWLRSSGLILMRQRSAMNFLLS